MREAAQSKCTWTFHKSHSVREFTSKMLQTSWNTLIKHRPGPTLREPAQSKCTGTFDYRTALRGSLQVKCRGPRPRRRLCVSLRSRIAFGRFIRGTLCGNLQVKCRRPAGAPGSSTGLYTYRKNPSVWAVFWIFLGKNRFLDIFGTKESTKKHASWYEGEQ